MTAEADQIGSARVSLPDIPAYLRSVYDLGRRSLRPALPALALLFFYSLGTRTYAVLTNYSGGATFGAKAAGIAGPLLFLVLIPILMYPLQESLLRGRPPHFLGAIRHVLERSVNLTLSVIAQALILLGPACLLWSGLLPGPVLEFMWNYLALVLYTYVAFILVAFFFMIFATPAVVLDGEGPLHSLRTSYHLATRNLGSVLGRLLAFAFLATVAYGVAAIPSSILGTAARTPGVAAPLKLAAVICTSAADTLLLPFWVAAVLVLYRSLRPWTDEGRA